MILQPSSDSRHIPVMLMESLENLNIKNSGIYVDGTLGLGGHSEEILKKIDSGLLLGIDRDNGSLELAKKRLSNYKNFKLFHDSYKNLKNILFKLDITGVDGILLDLGLSSYQLEDNQRGFSHKHSSELDMRFDNNIDSNKADDIIKKYDLKSLTKIFRDFGEERNAYRIAKMIKESDSDINVLSITSMIDRVTPYRFRVKTYSRIFQALRIETNKELEHLENFLSDFTDLLNPGGRLVVISYHSIEDRIVKHKMKDLKKEKSIELIFKKPLIPSEKEVQINKRSRSAKMRVGEKIG
jgi:16S rRNA (cytosine1402-N4)-methyltransferase